MAFKKKVAKAKPSDGYSAPFAPKIAPKSMKKDPFYHPQFRVETVKAEKSQDFDEDARDGYLETHEFCFFCLEKGIMTPAVYVHHLLRRLTHPERLNDERNFVQVCAMCHLILHNQAGSIDEQRAYKSKEEQLISERGID